MTGVITVGTRSLGFCLLAGLFLCKRLSLDIFKFIFSFSMLHGINLGIVHGWD